MFRYILILLTFICFPSFAEYQGLKKLSKNNSFMDDKGNPYLSDTITDKENTLLLIWNHGSGYEDKQDKCKKKPKFGYTWHGAVPPAILVLHNKKINGLEIKIFRVCSGVIGMNIKELEKIEDLVKKGKKIDTYSELKQQMRQNIILDKVNEFIEEGYNNIIIGGYSAGGWASLNLMSRYPDKFKGAIALHPAFAGPIKEWNKNLPHWGFFRAEQIKELQKSSTLNALVFIHNDDVFETPQTLSFLNSFNDIHIVDYSELEATECTRANVNKKMRLGKGHDIPESSCFTNYIKENKYFIKYLESLF